MAYKKLEGKPTWRRLPGIQRRFLKNKDEIDHQFVRIMGVAKGPTVLLWQWCVAEVFTNVNEASLIWIFRNNFLTAYSQIWDYR